MSEVEKLRKELRVLADALIVQLEWADALMGLNARGKATLRRARRAAAKEGASELP